MGLDPFDLTHGERWVADGALYCKAGGIGIPINEAEANEELINEICPEFDCLGRSACRWEIAKVFFCFFFFLQTFNTNLLIFFSRFFTDVQNCKSC